MAKNIYFFKITVFDIESYAVKLVDSNKQYFSELGIYPIKCFTPAKDCIFFITVIFAQYYWISIYARCAKGLQRYSIEVSGLKGLEKIIGVSSGVEVFNEVIWYVRSQGVYNNNCFLDSFDHFPVIRLKVKQTTREKMKAKQ